MIAQSYIYIYIYTYIHIHIHIHIPQVSITFFPRPNTKSKIPNTQPQMLHNCQINNFQITKQIGSGAFGLVFHAIDLISENEYAIKAILKNPQQSNKVSNQEKVKKSTLLQNQLYHFFKSYQNKLFLPSINLDSIKNLNDADLLLAQGSTNGINGVEHAAYYKEIALHLRVHDHNNVVTIHQILESSLATFIVMDYYPIDLFTSIVDKQHFSQDPLLIKKVFLQLCSVLQYCHENHVYHCDIKPENILLDKQDNVYLCDFGLSTIQPCLPMNVCVGSSYYMPPERSPSCEKYLKKTHQLQNNDNKMNQLSVSPQATQFPTALGDVWSIGIILINLTCIRNPWLKADCANDNTFQYFLKDPSILKKILPVSEDLYQVLLKVLKLNPWQRISLNQLIMEVAMLKCFNNNKDSPLYHAPILTLEQIETFTNYNKQEIYYKKLMENYDQKGLYSSNNSTHGIVSNPQVASGNVISNTTMAVPDSEHFSEESRCNSNIFDSMVAPPVPATPTTVNAYQPPHYTAKNTNNSNNSAFGNHQYTNFNNTTPSLYSQNNVASQPINPLLNHPQNFLPSNFAVNHPVNAPLNNSTEFHPQNNNSFLYGNVNNNNLQQQQPQPQLVQQIHPVQHPVPQQQLQFHQPQPHHYHSHAAEPSTDFITATSRDTTPNDSMEKLVDYNLNNKTQPAQSMLGNGLNLGFGVYNKNAQSNTSSSSVAELKMKHMIVNHLNSINSDTNSVTQSLNNFLTKLTTPVSSPVPQTSGTADANASVAEAHVDYKSSEIHGQASENQYLPNYKNLS